MNRFTSRVPIQISPVLTPQNIAELRASLDDVYCDEKVGEYLLDIVFATRHPADFKLALKKLTFSTNKLDKPKI
jgi:MoxR-like ATPase